MAGMNVVVKIKLSNLVSFINVEMMWVMQIVRTNHPFRVAKQLNNIDGLAVGVKRNEYLCNIARSHVVGATKVRTISNACSGRQRYYKTGYGNRNNNRPKNVVSIDD